MAPIKQHVVLDHTLQQLYSLDQNDVQNIVLVYAVPTAEVQMSSTIPLSRKFAYQSPLATTTDSDELARLFLQVVPQLFGFIAGKMPLVLYDLQTDRHAILDTTSSVASAQVHRNDAQRVYEQLSPSQRPELSFVAGPEDIVLPPATKIAVAIPMDCMLQLPHLADPESHYEVLSKSALAISGLPTPQSEVIETVLQPHQTCNDALIDSESARMTLPISQRLIPFIIKMPQALSGQGTFIIRTETDRESAFRTFKVEIKRMLRQLNESNVHMRPCSFVL